MEWRILEHRKIGKLIHKNVIPKEIVKEYTIWKSIVTKSSPYALRNFPGYHDESLKEERKGQRSSKLNFQYRVIYEIIDDEIVVQVIDLTPHKY